MRWLVNSKLVYLIPTPMLSSLLEFWSYKFQKIVILINMATCII
jgi:hypothetical protein